MGAVLCGPSTVEGERVEGVQDGAVSTEWLSDVLGDVVETADVVPIVTSSPLGDLPDGGGNSGCYVTRVHVTYSHATTSPEWVVIKGADLAAVAEKPFLFRVLEAVLFDISRSDCARSEHHFYTMVASKVPTRTPHVYRSTLQDSPDPNVICGVLCNPRPAAVHTLVMEDLSGATSYPPLTVCPLKHAVATLRNVATLHSATHPFDSSLGAKKCDNYIATFGLRGSSLWRFKAGFGESAVMSTLIELWGADGVAPKLRGLRTAILDPDMCMAVRRAQRGWDELVKQLGDPTPDCVVHGDCHHWNNVFVKDEAVLLDWQFFGEGRAAWDVAYFLNSSVDDLEQDRVLLEAYCQKRWGGLDGRFVNEVHRALADMGITLLVLLGTGFGPFRFTPATIASLMDTEDCKIRSAIAVMVEVAPRAFRRMHAALGHLL
eukprot:Sspe_Gene.96260::Locus_68852_Transcript_1_1_Confidence_1.000_Length_1389::g.96260::m.96260